MFAAPVDLGDRTVVAIVGRLARRPRRGARRPREAARDRRPASALLLASLAGYWLAGRGAAPRRHDAPPGGGDLGRRSRGRACRCPRPTTSSAASARRSTRCSGGSRRRSSASAVRRRRQPRAAHAARPAQDRARARAPARAGRGRAARRDRLGDRGDRPADRASPSSCCGRAPRGRRAATSIASRSWSTTRSTAISARFAARAGGPGAPALRGAAGGAAARGRPPARRAGAHEPGRQRAASTARATSRSRRARQRLASSST